MWQPRPHPRQHRRQTYVVRRRHGTAQFGARHQMTSSDEGAYGVSETPWGSRDGGSSTALPRGVTLAREETLVGRMGIDVTQASADRTVATMPVEPNRQPYGLLHGGASAVLAETVGSIAAAYHAHTIGKLAVGVELNCTHHRAVRTGQVTGTATKLHAGTSAATYEIVVVDEQDRRVCTSRLTCMLIDRAPGSPGAPSQDPEGVVDSDDGDEAPARAEAGARDDTGEVSGGTPVA